MREGILEFLVILVVVVAIVVVAYLLYRQHTKRKIAAYLLSLWGRQPDRDISANEQASIKQMASFLESWGGGIDDITWNDLEMDKVYAKLNHCLTTAGDEMLYATLRGQDKNVLEPRAAMIDWAAGEQHREVAKTCLYKAGRVGNIDIRMLLQENPYKSSMQALAILLCAGLLTSIVLVAMGITVAVLATVAFAGVNIFLANKMNQQHAQYIHTISYLIAVIRSAHDLYAALPNIPTVNRGKMAELLGKTTKIRKNAILELFYSSDSIMMLFNSLFLLEMMSFATVAREMKRRSAAVLELYKLVGLLDAMIAAASWRAGLDTWCRPVWTDDVTLQTERLVHPMLKDAVPNDLSVSGCVLFTGSNATGKSTFLKAAAVNAILGQSIATCTARHWESGFFRVLTSMALRDDITAGESYFITEIKSLKRMLDAAQEEVPCLFVIDEVLRGTNTGERIAASSEVLAQFCGKRCICLAATHDIELTYILEDIFANMHFTERVEAEGMVFDYKLRTGRSQSRNAIKLLGILGYDNELVRNARQRLDRFNDTGSWKD